MFELQKSAEFSAAHSLREYDGPCVRNHGHNYRLEVVVQGNALDELGMLVDFGDLDAILAPLVARLDHRNLNEVSPFDTINPTAEAIAAWFYREIRPAVETSSKGRARLAAVRVWETPDACATYSE